MGGGVLRSDDLQGPFDLGQRWSTGNEPYGSTGTIQHVSRTARSEAA